MDITRLPALELTVTVLKSDIQAGKATNTGCAFALAANRALKKSKLGTYYVVANYSTLCLRDARLSDTRTRLEFLCSTPEEVSLFLCAFDGQLDKTEKPEKSFKVKFIPRKKWIEGIRRQWDAEIRAG